MVADLRFEACRPESPPVKDNPLGCDLGNVAAMLAGHMLVGGAAVWANRGSVWSDCSTKEFREFHVWFW